jgi:hypothetical protein
MSRQHLIVAGWAAWTMILASAFVYVAFFMAVDP